jgi:hypothetical protein
LALFSLEFGSAERVKPIILDSYAAFRDESSEHGVEHGRRDPPEFSLEIGLSQAPIRGPSKRREEQPVRPAQRIEMGSSEDSGALRVPRGEAGGGIDGIGEEAQ